MKDTSVLCEAAGSRSPSAEPVLLRGGIGLVSYQSSQIMFCFLIIPQFWFWFQSFNHLTPKSPRWFLEQALNVSYKFLSHSSPAALVLGSFRWSCWQCSSGVCCCFSLFGLRTLLLQESGLPEPIQTSWFHLQTLLGVSLVQILVYQNPLQVASKLLWFNPNSLCLTGLKLSCWSADPDHALWDFGQLFIFLEYFGTWTVL